ncbi:MAG: hypothetical protein JST16_16835 [Bdellovibrionales bacterium]|nr:hypothetical protein [Bdellovibrionales bacterium]
MKKMSMTAGLILSVAAQANAVKKKEHFSGGALDVSAVQSCLYDMSKMVAAKADPQSLKQKPIFVGDKVVVNDHEGQPLYYLDGQRLYRSATDREAMQVSGDEAKRVGRVLSHELLRTYWMIAANAIERNATYGVEEQLKVLECAKVFSSPKAQTLAMAAANQIGSRHGNNETLTSEGLNELNPDHN